jgi:hypothetical protein
MIETVERATQRLAELDLGDFKEVERALSERAAAIERLTQWISANQSALGPDLAARLEKIFDAGASIALRIAIARQGAVSELSSLNRELALLRALLAPAASPAPSLDCNG